MSRSLRYPTSIAISTSTRRRLKAQADRYGHRLGSLIVWVLETWLDEQEKRRPLPATKPAKEKP